MAIDPDEHDPMDFYNSGNLDDAPKGRIGDNSGEDEDEALEAMDLMDLLKEGRKIMTVKLIQLVRTGQATPADMNNLRQLLKDNGVVMGDPTEGARNGNPAAAKEPRELPQFRKPEYDER